MFLLPHLVLGLILGIHIASKGYGGKAVSEIFEYIFSINVVLMLSCGMSRELSAMVQEKDEGLKEYMKIFGITKSALWVSKWIFLGLIMFIYSCITTALLKGVGMHVNWVIMLVFTYSVAMSYIAYVFLLSTYFNSAKMAGIVMSLFTPISLVGIFVANNAGIVFPYAAKVLLSIIFPMGLVFGSAEIGAYETIAEYTRPNNETFTSIGGGMNWTQLFDTTFDDVSKCAFIDHCKPVYAYSIGVVIIMLWVNSLVYMIMTVYVESIMPGKYGIPQPWNFFVLRWFKSMKTSAVGETLAGGGGDDILVEPVHTPFTAGVSIKKLCKSYDKKHYILSNVSMDLYENQITVLLGHNGSGKTTTLSILTGLFPSTSGSAEIYGNDIRSNMHIVHQDVGLGYCPQSDFLFKNLTVIEHLILFGSLSGQGKEAILKEACNLLDELGMREKQHTKIPLLSGGQKRKLSIAISFIGGKKFVVLDEATSGIDPASRREIWKLLNNQKEGRTIFFCTQHMDEADALADRIGILSAGKLVCIGSSSYLKNTYGKGYRLRIFQENDRSEAI